MAVTAVKRTAFSKRVRAEFARIQASNKQFKRVGKTQRRILVAQDAIGWAKLGMFEPSTGNYVVVESVDIDDREDISGSNQLHNQILERVDSKSCCEVCGVGGLLVSKCMRFDKFAVDMDLDDNIDLSEDHIEDGLSGLFSDVQLAMIEIAFEVWYPENDVDDDYESRSSFGTPTLKQHIAAAKFGKRFKNVKNRFIAIMKNIIDNGGTFKPGE